jgi:PAS domain S-box-containing protein
MTKVVSTTELERLASLWEYQILDTEPEPIFDNLTQLAAAICQTPVAAISMIDLDRVWFKAITGLKVNLIPLQELIYSLSLKNTDLILIKDTLVDKRTKNLSIVTSSPKIRFYVGLPIIGANGYVLGTLCIVDYQPRRLSDRQIRSLKIVVNQVIQTLELRRKKEPVNPTKAFKKPEIDYFYQSITEITTPQSTKNYDREFLSLSSDLLSIWGTDGHLKQLLNTAWETTLGYDSSELLDKPLIEFVHPEDRSSTCQELAQIVTGKGVKNFSNRCLCKNGSLKWIDWSTVPITNSNLIYAIGRDVTESRLLKASIQELDNINFALDRAAILMVIDIKGLIKYVNQKLCQLSLFSLEELIGKTLNFLESDQYSQYSQILFQQIWTTLNQLEIWKGEIKFRAKDGQYFWVDITIVPLIDRQGQLIHYVGIGNDITDKKQLEKQFLHAQRLESIGTMAGGISHDLNNILTPILTASQLLQLKFPQADPRTKQLLKTLEINSKRGASLVKQVLSFARGLDATKIALTLKHLIVEIQQIISQTFPRNIEIVVEVSPNLWMVLGDPTQMHQVLMNLTVNSRDAMTDGGTLTICAQNITIAPDYARLNIDAQVGPYVLISVMDTGVGIPPEIIDRIFDPFFTTKDLGQGTGLGLATVLTIIKSHNGFIRVDSKLGKGSIFQIYLPAITNSETKAIFEPEISLGKGELILVVDDENLIVETTKTTLENYNYRVLIASDGIEAIAVYAQRKHDINAVIVDLMMPIMDGAQTIRILRRLNPLVKIITISGLEGSSQPYNVNDIETFLPKPYTPRDLLETLSQVLHKNRSGYSANSDLRMT